MTECMIVWRNTGNGKVGTITDGDSDNAMVYRDYDAAVSDIPNIPILRAYPYQIIELEI